MNEETSGATLGARTSEAETSLSLRDASVRRRLGGRSLVLVGLMGAGKSTIGRRLGTQLGLPFRDADNEIEAAAGMSVSEIFAVHGEHMFRDGERRVIARLLQEGPLLLATGGGAYMNPETRARIREAAVSVWLKADLETLMKRVRKRTTRPLLKNPDPEGTMRGLMEQRYPVYALADIIVETEDMPRERVVERVLAAVDRFLDEEPSP